MTRSPIPSALLDLANPLPGINDERVLRRLFILARLIVGGHLAEGEEVPDEEQFSQGLASSARQLAAQAGRSLDGSIAVIFGRAAASRVYCRLWDPAYRCEIAGQFMLIKGLIRGGDEGGDPERN